MGSFYAQGIQLQAGITKTWDAFQLGVGLQLADEALSIITRASFYQEQGIATGVEFSFMPASGETGWALSFGLPIKHDKFMIEPNIGLYRYLDSTSVRLGIRLIK